ncbi:MAG TPA: trypsin-like peptidase domain-containing protein [Thermoanaerobaculia bacterium]|nr:trypsin-like peptidase domain-containing protein [Thermoanaerobaculia bacterium]
MLLDGSTRRQLREILANHFNNEQFDLLVTDLGYDRENITSANGKPKRIDDVLAEADRGGWLDELVERARQIRFKQADLYAFASERLGLGIRSIDASQSALQRIVVQTSSFLNVAQWREAMATIERRVARIRYRVNGGNVYGTGFLVGPSAVMTNYHVVELLIDNKARPEDVRVEFDYKLLPGGNAQEGRTVGLDDDWCVDASKYSAADKEVSPATPPTVDELDYAVLRLKEPVANETVPPDTSDTAAPQRGFVSLDEAATNAPGPGTAVFIVQHPKGEPLSMAMETQGMLAANANATRLRYQTNTEGGSSGSPVFDQHWKLIALHHAGDPDFSQFHKPQYNQGVPIHLIVERLKRGDKYAAVLS